jgi:hypothetical protein
VRLGDLVLECAANVDLKLVRAVERRNHLEIEQTAAPVIEAGSFQFSALSLSDIQTRTYRWCSPPKIGNGSTRPTLSASRGIGGSLSSDRCVRNFVVILFVAFKQMTKMLFVEDDDVIKAISADGSDQPFGESIVKSSPLHLFRLIGRRRFW